METLEIFLTAFELFTYEDKEVEKKYKDCLHLLISELAVVEYGPSSELEILLNDLQELLPEDDEDKEVEEEEEGIEWEEDEG